MMPLTWNLRWSSVHVVGGTVRRDALNTERFRQPQCLSEVKQLKSSNIINMKRLYRHGKSSGAERHKNCEEVDPAKYSETPVQQRKADLEVFQSLPGYVAKVQLDMRHRTSR